MPNSGYPTPDNFEGGAQFVCVPLVVPNKTEFLAAIYGLYGQMANEWFWKQFGTMSPAAAAALSSRGLALTDAYSECGGTMTCDDIADCVEVSETLQNAIATNQNIAIQTLMTIANSGLDYPSVNADSDTINTIFGAIGTDKNDEIKELPQCNLDELWAGIRDGIVQRLDDNARSALEWLVSKADLGQRATAVVGAIPIFGSMAKAVLDQMVELAPDMLNLYEAYSSIETMDEIACEIFGLVCAECRYPTYDEVFSYYAAAGITGFNDIDDIVIAAATDLLFGSTELAALAFYHTLIAYELLVLYMGSKFYGFSGSSALITMASLGEDFANDNWIVLCDTCNESYAIVVYDFTIDQQGWYLDTADGNSADEGVYIAGQGWRLTNSGGGQRCEIAMQFNPVWEVRAVAILTEGAAISARSFSMRPTQGTTTGQSNLNLSNSANEYNHCADGLVSINGYNEIQTAWQVATQTTPTFVRKVAIIFNFDAAPNPSTPTADNTLC